MNPLDQLAEAQAARPKRRGELVLRDLPPHTEQQALCQWLTETFALDEQHPITGGVRHGLAGPEGHVELRRFAAPPIRFEPATRINAPNKLIESLSWQTLPTDSAPPAYKSEHCRLIAHAVRMLCGHADTVSAREEVTGVIGAFLESAEGVEGTTTYGTTQQRYEAAAALQRQVEHSSGRPYGPPRYLIDANTGELVIRVADLAAVARVYLGTSLPRGFLDARIQALDWQRIELSGYSLPGRDGRRHGTHARCSAYRGLLTDPDSEAVNT